MKMGVCVELSATSMGELTTEEGRLFRKKEGFWLGDTVGKD
jgi:hypothetical protein